MLATALLICVSLSATAHNDTRQNHHKKEQHPAAVGPHNYSTHHRLHTDRRPVVDAYNDTHHELHTNYIASRCKKRSIKQMRICKKLCMDWLAARGNLTVCRWFPTTCARCTDSDAARGMCAIRMQRSIGSSLLLPACIVALIIACWRWRRRPLDRSRAGHGTVAGLHAAGWPPLPVELVQAYVAMQLLLEAGAFQAPESCALQAPELAALHAKKWDHAFYNPDGFFTHERLATARTLLLAAWLAFLILPARRYRWPSVGCFWIGAACYCQLAVLNLTNDPSHTNQPAILFVFAAALGMPFLGGQHGDAASDAAGRWMTQFLALCVLAPVYLAAGLSKLRYNGIADVLNGNWLHYALTKGSTDIAMRSVAPGLLAFVIQLDSRLPIMSWGAFAFEVALPALVLVAPPPASARHAGCVHLAFVASAIGFHAFNFVLLGANFLTNVVLLLVLGAAILPGVEAPPPDELLAGNARQHETDGRARLHNCPLDIRSKIMKIQPDLAFAGSIVTLATLAGWALNNADADSRGELGKWFGLAPPYHKGIDRMFPFSSFAMYTPREYNTHPKGVRTTSSRRPTASPSPTTSS